MSAETVASTDKDLAIADRIPRADRMGNSVQVQVANLGGASSNCLDFHSAKDPILIGYLCSLKVAFFEVC